MVARLTHTSLWQHTAAVTRSICEAVGPGHGNLRAVHLQAPPDLDHQRLAAMVRTRLGELGLPGITVHIQPGRSVKLIELTCG